MNGALSPPPLGPSTAPSALTPGTRGLEVTSYRTSPRAALLALFVSLLGLVGVALLLYEFKFHHVTDSFHGLPTRMLFVFFVALAAAPFYVSALRRVPVPYLIAPILVIVFLYPIFAPYGLPFSHDPTYVFQFSQALLNTGTWRPLLGVTAQAKTYSYYPGAAIFNAEVAALTTLPPLVTFNWSVDLLRLLVIPLAIYSLAARFFGPRSAPLAALLYLTLPSVEMNIPTQQDFATVWFILAVVALGFLATSTAARGVTFLRAMVVAASIMVVISHHVSTYVLLGFLIGLAILPWILLRRDPYPNARMFSTMGVAVAFALVWVAAVTLPVIQGQWVILTGHLTALTHPAARAAGAAVAPGQSFPLYELGWIGLAILLLVVLSLIALFEVFRVERYAFVTFGILASLLVGAVAIPFASTGFNFLALRVFEFAGVFFAPAVAWWITHRLALAEARPRPARATVPSPSRPRAPRPRRATARVVVAAIVVLLIVGGGSLVPLSTRDQFAKSPGQVQVSSALIVNRTAYATALWASAHLNHNRPVWGDYLTYTVLGGFGHFEIVWDAYPAFENATFTSGLVARLFPGEYIVTDVLMTIHYSPPMFFGPANDQPKGAIPAANIDKYNDPGDFAVLYQNSLFTIYEVVHVPPVGP